MAPLPLSELIRRVGDDKITIQYIADNLTNIRTRRRQNDVVVSFATGPQFINPGNVASNEYTHVGMAIWLPAPLAKAATAPGDWTRPDVPAPLIVPGVWRPLTNYPPPPGNVLATNNLSARDAFGVMSHVWIGHPIPSVEHGGWIVFTEADRIVMGITHWHPLPAGIAAGGAVDATKGGVLL